MKPTALTLSLLLVAALTASAGDYDKNWPQWRGPLGNGVAPHGSPPVEWSEEKNVRWKVELPGAGLSTPIIWGDRIYLTTAISVGQPPKEEPPQSAPARRRGRRGWMRKLEPHELEYVVMAIDRTSGKTVWKKTVHKAVPNEGTHADASWASGSAVTDGKRLVAHFGSNGTYCLDLAGEVKWSVDLGDMVTRNSFGDGSSPAIHDGKLIVNWDHEGESFIAVLDLANGKTVWKDDRDEPTSWSTPLVVESNGKPQVVVAATGATRGYDLASGEVVWSATGMTTNTIPSPVAADGRVFVMSGFRGNALQAIDFTSARGDVTESKAMAWSYDKDTPYVPSPLLYDDHLYFLKNNKAILANLDARTGKEHFVRQRLAGLKGVYASPVGAADRVYVVGRGGITAVLRKGAELELLATNTLDDRFDASPAIVGNQMFLRGRSNLYCLAEEGDQSDS